MMSQAGKDSPTLSGFIDRGRISSRASLSRHILACCQAFGEACRPMRNNRGTKIDLCLGRSEHGSILELLEIWRHRVVFLCFARLAIAPVPIVLWQTLPPLHSLHRLFSRLCWQMHAPPHSLHRLICRLCWQMLTLPRFPACARSPHLSCFLPRPRRRRRRH